MATSVNAGKYVETIRTAIALTLVIDGISDTIALTTYSSVSSINEIPTANCGIAVGFAADTGELSAIHAAVKTLLVKPRKATVYAAFEGDFDAKNTWPLTPAVIFEGFATGIGYSKNNGRAVASIGLIHWASSLGFASAISQNSHPSNPLDMTFNSIANLEFADGSTLSELPDYMTSRFGGPLFDEGSISQDLWGNSIKPLLCALTSRDFIRTVDDARLGPVPEPSKEAQEALSRIEGPAQGTCDFTQDGKKYAVPLAIEVRGAGGKIISTQSIKLAQGISDQFAQMTIEQFGGSTIWHKLVEFASNYMAAIIPMVDRLLVVPFVPTMRTAWRTVDATEFDSMDSNMGIPRPIRAVVVYGAEDNLVGDAATNHESPESRLFGGMFSPDQAAFDSGDLPGMLLLRRGLPFMKNVLGAEFGADRTTGMKETKPTASATSPAVADDDKRDKTVAELSNEVGAAHAAIAKWFYHQEMLRGRGATINGKLRFDIAPGSIIKIVNRPQLFQSVEEEELDVPLVGCVMGLSINIDAEQSMASTSYSLGYIRTEKENQSDAFSVENHPFYRDPWYGAPLVPEYEFDPKEA